MARKRAATKNAVEGGQEQPGTDDVAAGAAPAKATAKDEKFSTKAYERELKKLHVELVKLQEWVLHEGLEVHILFEGRDGADHALRIVPELR